MKKGNKSRLIGEADKAAERWNRQGLLAVPVSPSLDQLLKVRADCAAFAKQPQTKMPIATGETKKA